MDFDIQTYWVDHRLTFNVQHNISELIVDERNLKFIWLPDTYSENSMLVRVQRTFNKAKTAFLRLTSTGAITHETAIGLKAECAMNLANFPFDRQNCSLVFGSCKLWATFCLFKNHFFRADGKPENEIVYQWRRHQVNNNNSGSSSDLSVIFRNGGINLPEFRLVGYEQWRRSTGPSSVTGRFTLLGVSFILDRYYEFYVVRLYVPAFLGVVISFLPFWLGRKSHFSRLSLGLSTVFTTSSLIAQTSSRLPVVAYLTALDVYLYTCYTVVTASLIEYALACYCETKTSGSDGSGGDGGGGGNGGLVLAKRSLSVEEGSAKRIDLFAKVLFPLGFALFNIVYIVVVVVIVHGYSNEKLTPINERFV